MRKARVVSETVHSKVLEDNPLGDSPERELLVYLPPGYDEEQDRRYPSIYVLTGFTGRGRSLLNVQPFEPNLAERTDRLIQEGMPPVILVMPDCFTALGGSQYINSAAIGRYEDHIVEELVPFVDARYRTRAERVGRGVVGKSSGGYASVVLGMRHPDVWGALASHSGDMYFEACYKPDFPLLQRALEKAGGVDAWWEAFRAKPKKEGPDIGALNVLAMSAAYSPSPGQPLGIDLPFDPYTGELREDVWRRWLEHDPVYMVDRYADALRGMMLVFLDCGTRDQYNLHLGARILSSRLNALGVPHEHEEFDDNHNSISYRYDVSLPKLARALSHA